MARTTSTSGPGYTRTKFPGGGGDGDGGNRGRGRGRRRGGGGLELPGNLGGIIDPGLIRQAMLLSLEQRRGGYDEWLKNQRLQRELAESADRRASASATREEDLFRNRNLPANPLYLPATPGPGMSGGAGGAGRRRSIF